MGAHTTTIALQVHAAADQLPDADTDVLVFAATEEEAQLGAYVGHDEEGPLWVGAGGEVVDGVTHWAELPNLAQVVGE